MSGEYVLVVQCHGEREVLRLSYLERALMSSFELRRGVAFAPPAPRAELA